MARGARGEWNHGLLHGALVAESTGFGGPDYGFATQVQFLLTERCNLACAHCAVPAEDSPAAHELDATSWRGAVDTLTERGIRQFWFTGGEPLLRADDVFAVAAHAAQQGADQVVIVSNGTRLRPAVAAELAALQRWHPAIRLHVSLDGATGPSNDLVRGPGAFDRTIAGVTELLRHGGRLGGIQTVLHQRNVHELDDFASLVRRFGASSWNLFGLSAVGRGGAQDALRLATDDWEGVLTRLDDLAARSGARIAVMGPIDGEDWDITSPTQPRASQPTSPTCVVGPDGEAFTCPPLRHLSLGRLVGTDQDLAQVVERFASVTAQACPTCRYLPMCAGLDHDRPLGARTVETRLPGAQLPTPVALAGRGTD